MSDLRSGKPERLLLRSFRPVMDGASFCWDLFFLASDTDLPEFLGELEGLVDAAQADGPAIELTKNLNDRVFVTCKNVDADGELDTYIDEHAGWIRWVKVKATSGRLTVEWGVRIEGPSELGSPIAAAWNGNSEVVCESAQQSLLQAAPPLPPEPNDEEPAPRARGRRRAA